jgi:hypothetical protein
MARSTSFNESISALLELSDAIKKNPYPTLIHFADDCRERSACQHINLACQNYHKYWITTCEPLSIKAERLIHRVKNKAELEILVNIMMTDLNLRLGPCWINMIARARGY